MYYNVCFLLKPLGGHLFTFHSTDPIMPIGAPAGPRPIKRRRQNNRTMLIPESTRCSMTVTTTDERRQLRRTMKRTRTTSFPRTVWVNRRNPSRALPFDDGEGFSGHDAGDESVRVPRPKRNSLDTYFNLKEALPTYYQALIERLDESCHRCVSCFEPAIDICKSCNGK